MSFSRHSAKLGGFRGMSAKAVMLVTLGVTSWVPAWAATYTVSKDGRGAFSTINAAVARSTAGDIVEILDAAVYAEQVTLDSTKAGITIRSSNPRAMQKPVIRWQDRDNTSPKTCAEAKNPALAGQYETNGAVRILRTRNVTIDGIAVDGGGIHPFGATGIWAGDGVDCRWPLQHGNAGITIVVSGDVVIRNCKISNAYFGINIKDRNEGGIFANPNPADIEPHNVVPLSGFGKTGNHLFERNRIHNNSFGMFFESVWDLGSVVRYNLFYNNHHPPARIAEITGLTSEGANQAGGAMLFKDHLYSPLAIYNNTFWKNFLIFSGIWQTAGIHLVFNNIYAEPYAYWNTVQALQGAANTAFDPVMTNRTYHSVYAAQVEPPKVQITTVQGNAYDQATQQNLTVIDTIPNFQVRIMNGMGDVERVDTTVTITIPVSSGPVTQTQNASSIGRPGNRIIGTANKAFPASANIRWLETKFTSTDTASASFLEPLWTDPEIRQYIVDQGWPASGVRDADGSIADLGAIPLGGIPDDNVLIRPIDPVGITGTTAISRFDLRSLNGSIQNPTLKYYRFLKLPSQPNIWGPNSAILPASTTMTPTPAALSQTGNSITSSIGTALAATEYYAFIEAIAEGTSTSGSPVSTSVGFLPYRKLDYAFEVKIFAPTNLNTPLTEVRVGETYVLEITPRQIGQSGIFTNTINPVTVDMVYGTTLYRAGTPLQPLTLPTGITGASRTQVVFTRVPPQGVEYIRATGTYTQGTNKRAFAGTSNAIRILSGPPEKVLFQDPPSKIVSPGSAPVIDPGVTRPVVLHVLDAFDNRINQPATVNIKSNNPTIGDLVGATTPGALISGTTDSAGVATFNVRVTEGDVDQTFELEAMITGKPSDKADLKVGKARDKLWILYADAATAYDESVELRGSAGTRLPVTIRASQDGKTPIAERNGTFTVDASSGLAVYGSETATTTSNSFTLVNGQVVIYVTGLRALTGGSLTATPTNDNTIVGGTRGKISFTVASVTVTSAVYSANNGFGAVDRLDIVFGQALKAAPESLSLAWPTTGQNTRLVTTGIALDPADAKHVIVTLATPFPAGLTTGGGALGSVWVRDPAAPEEPAQQVSLTITDGVGPLLDSGRVYEKLLTPGVDTLTLAFSEKLNPASLIGVSLQLLKPNAAPLDVTVLTVTDLGNAQAFKLVITDLGTNAPVAGDSIRILATGPITDALGNKPHVNNRPIVLKLKTVPRPPVLKPDFEGPYHTVTLPPTMPNFVIYVPGAVANQWKPVSGGQDKQQTDCIGQCGDVVTGSADGKMGRPAINVITDRGFKISVQVFSNTGDFLDAFQGEVTNADLGLDDRGVTTGVAGKYGPMTNGAFNIKITWSAKAKSGQKAGTGAYIARYQVTALREQEDGTFIPVVNQRDLRFGLLRGN